MKKFSMRGLFVAGLLAMSALLPVAANAQTVTQLPSYVDQGVTDLGNGPIEVKVLTGNAALFTSSSTGVGSTSGSSTSLTLTTSAAANPPCVGCIISGTGITSGTTVAAFNGTTGITLSAAMTVAASTPLAWGMACPTTPTGRQILVQAGVGGDLPLYTQARICGSANKSPGAALLLFAIGAH